MRSLEQLYARASASDATTRPACELDAALDGEAGLELRRLVPRDVLRATGAFFTGSGLAARVADLPLYRRLGKELRSWTQPVGGDLLSPAQRLPIARGFRETLDRWGRHLLGRDLQPEFVAAAASPRTGRVQRGLTPRVRWRV